MVKPEALGLSNDTSYVRGSNPAFYPRFCFRFAPKATGVGRFLSSPLGQSWSCYSPSSNVTTMYMARAPLPRALLSLSQRLSHSRRPFSQGLIRPAEPTRSYPQIRQAPQKSMKVATKEAMQTDAGMVNDIGLLPGTNINCRRGPLDGR